MKSLIACLQFITAIPLGKPQPFDAKRIIVSFPLAGLFIGLLLAWFDTIASSLWSIKIAAVLDVILLAAITGALHLDGLADTADGLYGQREREKALAIMKDSRVGAMGLVAVVCVLLLKAVSLGHVQHFRFLSLIVVPAYARSAMLFGMRFLSYSRGDEGTGSSFFKTPLAAPDFKWIVLPFLLSGFLGWRGVVLNLSFLLVLVCLILFYRKKLGGITGDMLGCMVEVMEAVLFLSLSIGGGR
jgi:adenosylcobinamide-GDP ribazoletransferase